MNMLFGFPLLSLIIWLPIAAGIGVLATGSDRNAQTAKWIALAGALAGFLVAIPLYTRFDPSTNAMQFVEYSLWIERFNVHYHLGVDGIAMHLILLNAFTTPLVVIAGWEVITKRVSQYMGAFLIMSGIVNGVFSALDAILFYVFWEASLIPMFLIIGVWGGPNRVYAAIKFFLYTLLGSLLMLVAFIYLYQVSGGSFSILDYHRLPLSLAAQILIFIAFLLAFAVKVPMWPVHTWLPDAHTEAPSGGSVVLAALMLKLGIYGFLRFSLPIVPQACSNLSWVMIILSLIAIVYIGLVAIVQRDMKKLIAYSSIAHMGFATLGCFMVYDIIRHTSSYQGAYMSLEGAVVQMIAHAFGSGAMFLGVGMLADRYYNHSRLIRDYGGIANRMPVFAAFFMLFAMSNVGLPGTAGFVGEFMVIMSAFQDHFWVAFF